MLTLLLLTGVEHGHSVATKKRNGYYQLARFRVFLLQQDSILYTVNVEIKNDSFHNLIIHKTFTIRFYSSEVEHAHSG